MARDFGGTKKWRTCYTSDGTSHSMLYAMDDKAHEQAIALESEVVTFGNMEAIQFYPTAIIPVGILTTEGCRGDGGLLLDCEGYRFMPDYKSEKKELTSRDVVSRRITEYIRTGKGLKPKYGGYLWLDITILGREHIEKNLREVKEICENFQGYTLQLIGFQFVQLNTTQWMASEQNKRVSHKQ